MPLTIADLVRKRPPGNQQIPYDDHRSAIHISDPSAADARDRRDGPNSSPEDVARVKKKKIERKSQTEQTRLQTLIFDEFRGILIDTSNPLIK